MMMKTLGGIVTEEKQTWYFTFGCGQENQGCYTSFYGTCGETRDKMVKKYGAIWAFQYKSEKGKEVIKRWNLKELKSEEGS